MEEEKIIASEQVVPEIDWHEKYLYLAAEMENMRKRFNKQLSNVVEYGKEEIFLDIITQLDNLLLNEKHTDNEDERNRMRTIINGFYTMLKKYNVEPLYSLNKRDMYFNPDTDNAVTFLPTDDNILDNSIVDVMKKGYKYKDKILRYEDVIIYKVNE
jgi:molecular chaperone GrpE